MGRLNDAWNALIGRTNARNRRANGEAQSGTQRPTGGNSFNYPTIGTGLTPWAPGAQTDYTRLAGNIRDNAVVSICLSWIRRQISQGCLQLGTYDPDDNTYEPLEDTAAGVTSQVLPLLRRPNATYSWRATLGATSDCLVVDGNAYWLKLRDFSGLGSTRELWWVPNGQIQVERETRFGSARLVRRYWYTRDGVGGWEPWEPEDVIHFRDGIDPDFPWMGLSALKRQVRNIAGVNAGESYTAAVLRNRHAGKILVPKAVMSGGMVGPEPDEKEMAAEKRALEHATENENAGRIHAATIAVDVVDLGMGPQEMALDQILDRPEGMVIASCGLNGMVLNVPSSHDTRTYSNWGEARRDAWESGVMPIQDLIAEELTHQLVFTSNSDGKVISEYGLPEGAMLYWERKDVSALREDADARTTRSTALFTSTVLPRNRALAEGGFDPIEDEEQGEAYYGDPSPMAQDQQDQMMGSADSSIDEMDPSFDPEAEADLTGDESNVEDTTDSVKARMGGVRKGMKKKVKPVKPGGHAQAHHDPSKHPHAADGKFEYTGGPKKKPSKKRTSKAKSTVKAAPHVVSAARNGSLVTRRDQKFVEDKNESLIAKSLGHSRLKDNEAVDTIAPRKGGGFDGMELKSIIKSGKKNASIKMKADALMRKRDFVDGKLQESTKHQLAAKKIDFKEGQVNVFHAVAADMRGTYARGKYADSYSGNMYYYKRGAGEFSLSQMHPVKDMAELKRLVAMKDTDLPPKARGTVPEVTDAFRAKAAKEEANKKVRKQRYLARVKAGTVGT